MSVRARYRGARRACHDRAARAKRGVVAFLLRCGATAANGARSASADFALIGS